LRLYSVKAHTQTHTQTHTHTYIYTNTHTPKLKTIDFESKNKAASGKAANR